MVPLDRAMPTFYIQYQLFSICRRLAAILKAKFQARGMSETVTLILTDNRRLHISALVYFHHTFDCFRFGLTDNLVINVYIDEIFVFQSLLSIIVLLSSI